MTRSRHAPILAIALAMCVSSAAAQTVYVHPGQANGVTIFPSLNAAMARLTTHGQPGEAKRILVMVNQLEIPSAPLDGGVRWSGDDDLTIDGDGDGDGVWCTLVCGENVNFDGTPNAENVVFRIQRSAASGWKARVEIRNFIMIPAWIAPGAVTQVARGPFSVALGAHPDAGGEIILENMIVTSSLPDGSAANPFVPPSGDATRWFRGLHTGSKSSGATQARTEFTFRNVVVSGTSLSAVTWFGDHSDITFGPGFVVTNSGANPVMTFVNSAYQNSIRFAGTSTNRNLFWNCGIGTSAAVIQVVDGSTSGTSIVGLRHTDFVSNHQGVLLDINGPIGPITASLLSCSAPTTFLQLNDTSNAPLVIETTTLHASTNEQLPQRIVLTGGREVLIRDSLFIGSPLEVESTSGELLAWRVSPPPLIDGPPAQVVDSPAEPPALVSSDVADYPLPDNIAAWRSTRLSLATSPFLRPIDAEAVQGVHDSTSADTPMIGGIVGVVRVSDDDPLVMTGPVLETSELAAAWALRDGATQLWAWREGVDRPSQPFAESLWRDTASGDPLESTHPLEAFLVERQTPPGPMWLTGALRLSGVDALPTSSVGTQSILPWPVPLSATTPIDGVDDTLAFIFANGTWKGFLGDIVANQWVPLTGEDEELETEEIPTAIRLIGSGDTLTIGLTTDATE